MGEFQNCKEKGKWKKKSTYRRYMNMNNEKVHMVESYRSIDFSDLRRVKAELEILRDSGRKKLL